MHQLVCWLLLGALDEAGGVVIGGLSGFAALKLKLASFETLPLTEKTAGVFSPLISSLVSICPIE